MTSPKRHHYLPEMYLAGFTDDGTANGRFHVYHRRTNTVLPQTPINTGVISQWYTVTADDGSKDSSVEKWLSGMETRAVSGLSKLRRGGEFLSPDERLGVAQFLAFLWIRGPDLHFMLEDVNQLMLEHAERFASKFMPSNAVDERKLGEDRPGVTLEDLRKLTKDGRVSLSREAVIPVMLFLAEGITRFVMMANWVVYRAPERTSFVTTDCPVVALPEVLPSPGPYRQAPLDPEVPKIVPISTAALLGFSGDAGGHKEKEIGQDATRAYNVLLAIRSNDFVIARNEAHVRSIVSRAHLAERGEKTRIWAPPTQVRPSRAPKS